MFVQKQEILKPPHHQFLCPSLAHWVCPPCPTAPQRPPHPPPPPSLLLSPNTSLDQPVMCRSLTKVSSSGQKCKSFPAIQKFQRGPCSRELIPAQTQQLDSDIGSTQVAANKVFIRNYNIFHTSPSYQIILFQATTILSQATSYLSKAKGRHQKEKQQLDSDIESTEVAANKVFI